MTIIGEDVTPRVIAPLADREPSVDGDWYLLALSALAQRGYTHVEIHFDTDARDPNAVRLVRWIEPDTVGTLRPKVARLAAAAPPPAAVRPAHGGYPDVAPRPRVRFRRGEGGQPDGYGVRRGLAGM